MSDFNDNAVYDNARFDDDLHLEKPEGKSRVLCLPFILIGGLVTTLGTLIGIFFLSLYFETMILSYIINIFPVGAIGAGLVAGSGYAITARLLQYKPSAGFILFICVLQFAMFFVGRYLEYVPIRLLVPEPPSFAEYYRAQIEDSEWTSKNSKEPYTMGKMGWGLEMLTALGFSLTSLLWIGILSAVAYCSRCRLFMKKDLEFVFPARAPAEKIKKNDTEALEAFQKRDADAFVHAMEQVVKIVEFLKSDQGKNPEETARFLGELRDGVNPEAKAVRNVPNQVKVTFSRCRDCDNFQLIVQLESTDVNNKSAMAGGELVRYLDGNFVNLAVETTAAEAA